MQMRSTTVGSVTNKQAQLGARLSLTLVVGFAAIQALRACPSRRSVGDDGALEYSRE